MLDKRPVAFVLRMDEKRRELGLGHGAWADYLGIDRSLWYMLRHGQKELSIAVLQRVMREWRKEFQAYLPDAVLAWRDRPAGCGAPAAVLAPLLPLLSALAVVAGWA